MTQAPTPGPLSVGDRVVAVADLRKHPDGPVWVKKGEEVGIVREYGVGNCIAGVALQDGREGDWAKSCFRLAPTAPVEASGSERDFGDSIIDCEIAREAFDSRPQPSGDTREAVARIIDPAGWATWDHQSGGIDRMGLVGVERNGAIMSARSYVLQSLKKTDAILAILSARPLALGGQQGEEADEEDDDDDPHSSCSVCGDEHPDGVLEDGCCPSCCDEEED